MAEQLIRTTNNGHTIRIAATLFLAALFMLVVSPCSGLAYAATGGEDSVPLIAAVVDGFDESSSDQADQRGAVDSALQPRLETQGSASFYGYIWPLKSTGMISQDFISGSHWGTDIAIGQGNDVVSMMDGTVKYVQQWDGSSTTGMQGYGNLVIVYHPKTGAATYYAHLDDITVTAGQTVSQYQLVGHVGTTGQSTGYHLHLELHLNAKSDLDTFGENDGTRVNPLDYVSSDNIGPAASNVDPEGFIDEAEGGEGFITAKGWAFDRDDPNANVEVRMYLGAPMEQGGEYVRVVANTPRPDVNSAMGISGNHGFSVVFKTDKRGTFPLYAYAVNVGGGSVNTQLANVFTVTVTDPPADEDAPVVGTAMHRLYNPNSGEHFYTADDNEKDALVECGWSYEGEGWKAPLSSAAPVYRLYNANAGDHHFTYDVNERDALVGLGWKDEGVGWYSAGEGGTPLYRQYNPNATTGSHNYTTSKDENDYLVSVGWREEGVGWYGL